MASRKKIEISDDVPEDIREQAKAKAKEILINGRPPGEFANFVRTQLIANKKVAPLLITDEKLGTFTLPATFEGIMVALASFDSMLLTEELEALSNTIRLMVPMGIRDQAQERFERAQREAAHEHMKENHPDQWDALQGWKV